MQSPTKAPEAHLQPIDYRKIKVAIARWVKEELGIEPLWERQNAPQLEYPYVSLFILSSVGEGGDPEDRRFFDTESEDQKIEIQYYEPTRIVLNIQAHVDVENGANDPAQNAFARCSFLQMGLAKQSVIDRLDESGLSIVDDGSVVDLSEEVNGSYLSRATLDITMRTAAVLTERIDPIESVEIESKQLGIDPIIIEG